MAGSGLPGPAIFAAGPTCHGGRPEMTHRAGLACALLGSVAMLVTPARAAEEAKAPPKPGSHVVVDVRSDRIVLLDITQVGNRLLAVGERGFALVSDDGGQTWKGVNTPVTRQLTAVSFKDEKVGVAVGHGGSFVRTEDGGNTWSLVTVDEAGPDSMLGLTHLGGDHFIAYGAFGLYFDSQDAGKTWTRGMVLAEDFDRHISQVIPVGNSLLLVAESGTLARSDDGGATWTTITSPYQGSYFGALAMRDGSVLVYGMRGNVYRTLDLGATWTKIETGTTTSIMSGRQLTDGRVMLVGNAGLILESADNGQSFVRHWSKPGKGLAALVEKNGGGIVFAGESGITPLDPAWLESP